MVNLFCDLDNTLIYSHRTVLPQEKTVVEYLNGKSQSYMTKHTNDFFKNQNKINLIPVTTRTMQQYLRLSDTLKTLKCRYVLICNGGILLEDGRIDKRWLDDTTRLAENEMKELAKAQAYIKKILPECDIVSNDRLLIYAVASRPSEIASQLNQTLDTRLVSVFYDRRKVYCIPSSNNKGAAVRRFSEYKGISCDIAAGDSETDISMLEAATDAFYPKTLNGRVANKKSHIFNCSGCFSDYICDELLSLIDSPDSHIV